MNIPRFVIAGAQSGVGKTTLTLGLLKALKEAGFRVQPFKVGPDYIDPGLHRAACETPSHNLDSWMGTEKVVKEVFSTYTPGKDVAVIEGVMGLFDGARGEKDRASTAHIAKILKAPVILVVNARGMARSCAALIKGYAEFDPQLDLAGVIFNNVGSENHANFLREIVEDELDIPCIGFLKRKNEITMPERHLGLLPAVENKKLKEQLDSLAELIKEDIDLDKLLAVARKAPSLNDVTFSKSCPEKKVRLGVAWDEAFNFYYHDSITYLQELGAEIHYFSPLRDKELPAVDGLYFGGGFPEIFLEELSSNRDMHLNIRQAHENGMPIYAECGGFMYLMEKLQDFEGRTFSGVGIIPGSVRMTKKLAALGYVKASPVVNTLLARPGETLRGHEFHWSEMEGIPEENAAYTLVGGKGKDGRREGYACGNLLGSYVHLHLRSNPTAARGFIKSLGNYGQEKAMDNC
ncbi:MAG: cobyrinic acid a,c-diamide synthase [Clostridia bacterium]|nr:Cobyrinic acid A,C-diamide synthase [Clostridiales bacterium]MDK2984852.1 cobyrinic acid a,c-diamide synthase [Clostridia bacterium]